MKARLIYFLLKLSACLPLWLSRAAGRTLGRIAWWLGGSARRVTERNIELAFPELSPGARQQLAKRSLQSTGELAAEMGFVWNRPWTSVREHILEVVGEDAVRASLAEGHGVMLLGPHLGNWEVVGLHLSELGDAVSLYEPPHLQLLDSMVRSARQRAGSTLVPTDAKGIVALVRALKRGSIAGILPDQVPPVLESGENSPFMGISCFTMTLASKLLKRSKAIAYFAFAERIKGGFRVHYIPAEPDIYSDELTVSLRALNYGVERCLRLCPHQYQWEYKRFKERPRGNIDYYAVDRDPTKTSN
ncbi:MAG: lysophospholipid acyltransferase family protein [Congregibacter sp.]